MNHDVYKERRAKLVQRVGCPVVVAAACEDHASRFRQDPTFLYYTGIQEPGCACIIYPSGATTLFVPVYPDHRADWVWSEVSLNDAPAAHGCDAIAPLGEPLRRIVCTLSDCVAHADVLAAKIEAAVYQYGKVSAPASPVVSGLCRAYGAAAWVDRVHDCTADVAAMRRCKSHAEVDALYRAACIAGEAHEAAACSVGVGVYEYEVQAAAEYMITGHGASPSFPTIIGGGERGTVLHYDRNDARLEDGQCVVVDLGAYKDGYCSDVTRTYPVGGTFTSYQAWVYACVEEAHAAAAQAARPGYYVKNDRYPEYSLHHIALRVLAAYGLDAYMVHSIGHHVGCQVHDCVATDVALSAGDVITIEPGVYDKTHACGVRLEDMYWIGEDGAVCLTDDIPRSRKEVEACVQKTLHG